MDTEGLGTAGRILDTVAAWTDHMVHNRPGMVVPDPTSKTGVRWTPVKLKKVDGQTQVFETPSKGVRFLRGVLQEDGSIKSGLTSVGRYQPSGLFPEVVCWLYRQFTDVYQLNAELSARWASWAIKQENRDLMVIGAAFLLVQDGYTGQAVMDGDEVAFIEDDFRGVGEAMLLLSKNFNPKLVLRVGEVLSLPGVAQINRELGFGRSARRPPLGRYKEAVRLWLSYRESNIRMLQGLVSSGQKRMVQRLASSVRYKPQSPRFFEVLQWRQKQSAEGHRGIALDQEIKADTWDDLSEEEICERIVSEKPSYKLVVGKIPERLGLTRAIMLACVESGSLSDKDMIMLVPTFEELGLISLPPVKARLEKAAKAATDLRSKNISKNVRSEAAKAILEQAGDEAMAKAMEEATRDLRVYFLIDKSSSLQGALEESKALLEVFLRGFPLERVHIAVFDGSGYEVKLKAPTAVAINSALARFSASGWTSHAAGIRALAGYSLNPGEDGLVIVVGDELDNNGVGFVNEVRATLGRDPVAFGVVEVNNGDQGRIVKAAARTMGVPCIKIDKKIFDDTYAPATVLRNLIQSAPVNASPQQRTARRSLLDVIAKTPLLEKPTWAL